MRDLDVGSTRTIAEQSSYILLIPEYTMPNVTTGDKIFASTGETPTAVPSENVFTVQGSIFAGRTRRQTLLCTFA